LRKNITKAEAEAEKITISQLCLEGTTYQNFINAIKSPATRTAYNVSIRRYLNHIKQKSMDDLLAHSNTNPRYIESQIIDYIMSLRNSGVSYATIQFLVAPIFTFYQLNDVILNRKKVSRYLGEYKRVVKDGAYTTEQIQQMLQTADIRMRLILLLLSSTGARVGSLPGLVLGNLTKLVDHGLYRIMFYEGTNNEYYTFTTNECATSVDSYLLYRQRCGEKISFNETTQRWEPYDTPLLRLQFDGEDVLQARNPRPMINRSVREALTMHLVRMGIREVEHLTAPNSPKRVRKPVSLSNGFRKHVISTFIEAGLNHEIRELLVDHSTMLDQHYFRPTEDQVLAEYLKAEPLLTINPSMRLRQEVETLRVEKQSWESLRDEVNSLKALLKG
jgi:integrase